MKIHFLCFWILALLYSYTGICQENSIDLGKTTLPLDEAFTITLIIQQAQPQNVYSAFPDIKGMQKREVSLTSSKETSNGKTWIVQRITQNYIAQKEGTYTLSNFSITSNGKEIKSEGATIVVGPPVNPAYKALQDSTLTKEIQAVETEYANVKDNAFLGLTLDKKEMYVGEGLSVILALYVSETNPVELESYKTGEQLVEILKKLKPANCWEEDFHIREFQSFQLSIRGRKYTQYKVYQATFYPFNADTIRFPVVGLNMLVKKQGGGKDTYQTFNTIPKYVVVKPLPIHPLRNGIAVGRFRMEESIEHTQVQTGKGFYYLCRIVGEGNFTTVNLSVPESNPSFDFFQPESNLSLNMKGTSITGSKSYRIYVLPREPGSYPWSSYFSWIYFNTDKRQYDTLRSKVVLKVTGESMKNQSISSSEMGTVYDNLESEDNQLYPLLAKDQVRWVANGIVAVMLLIALILILWKNSSVGRS